MGRRIALVLDGGAEDAAGVARDLVARGDRVTIVGPAGRSGLRETGARFVPVEIPATFNVVGDVRAAWRLRSVLRGPAGGAPDVVHAFGPRAGLAGLAASPKDVPVVVTWWKDVESTGSAAERVLSQADRAVARGADVCLCATSELVPAVLRLGARDARHLRLGAMETVGGSGPGAPDAADHLDALYRELAGR